MNSRYPTYFFVRDAAIFGVSGTIGPSSYDFVPDEILSDKNQISMCNGCEYRNYKASREMGIPVGPLELFEPACSRETCLIDNQNLLSRRKLNKSKEGER